MLNVISGLLSGGAAPAAATSYESIATVTVGAGGQASISFTSIPSTYKHLQIRGNTRATGDTGGGYDQIALNVNSDTSANYSVHQLFGDGASASAYGTSGQTRTLFECGTGSGSLANTFGALVIDILDYASTNKYKTFRILAGQDQNGSGRLALSSGLYSANTNAITSVQITPRNGNFAQYSQIALYGIKG